MKLPILLAIVLASTTAQAEFSLFNGVDSPGHDLVELDGVTLRECESVCTRVDACTAFTYNVRHHACFLKSRPNSNPSINGDAITGLWDEGRPPKIRVR